MEAPNKRVKTSHPGALPAQSEFVSLDVDDGNFGYGNEGTNSIEQTPQGPRAHQHHNSSRDPRFDRRHAQDHPISKHQLPGHEPWILVKTKFSRRFVHNTRTHESFWRVPSEIWPAVKEFEAWETAQREKDVNAKWAEEELKKMREEGVNGDSGKVQQVLGRGANAVEVRSRRRRSESLQREDEEAMMAELAAEAAPAAITAEGGGTREVLKTLEPEAGDVGYDSDGSYEYVEVTDDEGEEGEAPRPKPLNPENSGEFDEHDVQLEDAPQPNDDGPVEFTEDDIAHQLAAMGAAYGLDEGEYGSEPEEGWSDGAEGLEISLEDAANLFRELLDDSRISPFTPWEKIISDESDQSIMNDDRYTVLPTMKARREVFDAWVRDTAARIQEERAKLEVVDPKVGYLAFLAEKATPKLYWPEFKRKFKKEAEMSDRKMLEKERERLYREHINRLKLPESTRKADLLLLLRSVPLQSLKKGSSSSVEVLPEKVRAHLHFISLSRPIRDAVVAQYMRGLPT